MEPDTKSRWFDGISNTAESSSALPDGKLIELQEEAMKILSSETANYSIKRARTNSNYRWMKTVMSKGTINDKIAAYVVTIQENPVFNLDTINNMIGMVKSSKKKECIAVIDALSELFISDLLRPHDTLKTFDQQPLSELEELSSGNAITRRKYLSHWYFESQLKSTFNTFVQALRAVAHDSVDAHKEKAIAAMAKLLSASTEQRNNLLSHIVNKLGDPSQKVGAKAIYCLSQVLNEHSSMQGIMLKEIEKLIYRQNVGRKAQYYSLCFLSQFYFSAENADIASKLIDVYFSFFRKCVKLDDIDSRMMSVLLIGVNRAFPYAKMQTEALTEHIDTMYRIVHVANFNVSLNTLALLFQVAKGSDRFYSALYRKLLDPQLAAHSNPAILLNLIYKALSSDIKRERIIAFVKRLLQLTMHVQANLACGILFLISQISFKKQEMHILQLQSQEIEVKTEADDDDDEEDRYFDVDDCTSTNETKTNTISSSWVHRLQTPDAESKFRKTYDVNARNPCFANAEMSYYVELALLKHHFHPSMELFVENLMKGKSIVYTGDPLKDFALLKFLERFVFKNPKKPDQMRNVSIFARRTLYQPSGSRALPVMSNDYLLQDSRKIPVDEQYLFDYMKRRFANNELKAADDDSSDVESVASDEFEAMLTGISKDTEDLDFMQELDYGKPSNKSKKRRIIEEEEEEDNESMSDEDFSDEDDSPTKKARKSENIFAAAEEFSALLEDEGNERIAPGSLHQLANKDKSAKKQLDWESKRNHWIRGFNHAVHGKNKKHKH